MPSELFPVWDVSSWRVESEETAGGEEKAWLAEPGSDRLWLFKPVTSHEGLGDQGEDWAEKIVSEIAALLGVPSARVEMAERDGRPGALSLDLRPAGWEMHHGSVVMPSVVPGYRQGALNPRGRPGHSLSNIRNALEGVGTPPGSCIPSGFDAFDVFSGYVTLDALVANRDRHDDNWAILRPLVGDMPAALAGSYDHAGSLGYNLQDAERTRRIEDQTVATWAEKGTAWRFEHHGRPTTLVQLAVDALGLASAAARARWIDQLQRLDVTCVTKMVRKVPRMSDAAASFSMAVVAINRGRLLDGY